MASSHKEIEGKLRMASSHEKIEGSLSGSKDFKNSLLGCEEIEGSLSGSKDFKNSFSGCEEIEGSFSGSKDFKNSLSGCEEIEGSLSGSKDFKNSLSGCEEIEDNLSGCMDFKNNLSGCEEIEGNLSDQLEHLKLGDWSSLPPEVQDLILAFLSLNELFQTRRVCKNFHNVIKRKTFQQARARLFPIECSLSPLVFYAEKDSWHLRGFDHKNQVWKKLPPFRYPIPAPDPDLFKDFHVAGDKGLFCMDVGKASEAEKLYICNPLSGETFKLPTLKFSRHPVILNVHVKLAMKGDTITSSFMVIAIGSAAIGTESLSRKTDVFDSIKGKWEAAGDVPGADFSLNDYQTGVYCESLKLLLCVGFMVNGGKGILAFDVEKRQWREDWICPFYQLHPVTDTALTVYFAIAQLVECSGKIYLFSEQEAGRNVTHCIDRLDLDTGSEGYTWTRMVTRQRQGNRALLVYPEYICVPVGENKLCIFNTIEKVGVVYDMLKDPVIPENYEPLPSPPIENGIMFHSLNSVGYAFEPSFGISVPEDVGEPSTNATTIEESLT